MVASFFQSSLCAHMYMNVCVYVCVCDSRWLSGKESAGNTGDVNLILGWQGTLEEEMATNSSILTIDRGSWQATIHGVDKA